jgi:hypothetical protein
MRLRKPSLALATVIAALAAASAFDGASAVNPRFGGGPAYFDGGGFLYRAPQPSQSPPRARAPSSGSPQALPSQRMNRGGMGTMRGVGEMRGRR